MRSPFRAGDPIKLMFMREEGDVTYDAERLDAIRREKGLDRPFLVQYGEYTWHLIQGRPGHVGDFGAIGH